ncbi:MAG: response regulator transcription factor [Bacteroidales bacterium]|nr:response regulator transcription factor [Bacteroidales bacterium]
MKKLKVIIVDDHKMFREGLKFLLYELPNVEVIAEAEDGLKFLELIKTLTPDIVLMDIKMPNMDGITATKKALEIKPELKFIAITMFGDEDYYYKMIHAGVNGFLLKKSGSNELAEAIRMVSSGFEYFSVDILKNIIVTLGNKNQTNSEKSDTIKFTPREKEVFELICGGLSAKYIAEKLNISHRTVEGHKRKLFDKTGAKNISSLIMIGIKNKLIEI